MKRPLIGLAIAAAATIVPSLSAGADRPASFTDRATFSDANPCTGDVVDVTLDFDVTAHQHRNNQVLLIRTTSTQSDGWSGGGRDTIVIDRDGNQIESVNLRITDPTGERFFVIKYVIKIPANGPPDFIRLTRDCRR